jgi:formate hydrogenlyase transcriptional activator
MFPRSAALLNDSPSPRLGRFSPSSLSSLQSRAVKTSDAMPLLRAAAEQLPQGVAILSETGQVLDTNAAVPSIFGYGSDELVGLDFEALIPGYSTKLLEQFWITQEACRIGTDRPLYGRRKDGASVSIEMGLSKILKADSRLVIACIVDLTERRNLETRLAAAIDENVGIQRLMADLVCRRAAADPKGVDDMIRASLRKIAESLNLDVAIVWQASTSETILVPTHYWMPSLSAAPAPFSVDEHPWVMSKLRANQAAWFAGLGDLADTVDREAFEQSGFQTAAIFPIPSNSSRSGPGAVMFGSTTLDGPWRRATMEFLQFASLVIGQALARSASEKDLQRALGELTRLRADLTDESADVRRSGEARTSHPEMSESVAVRHAYELVELVAPTPSTVLLLGETGSGKDVFAQAIHDLSPRHQRPMIRVNCAAIPAALIESELFGRERGAYTGALSRQLGRFEAADQSTLFLDEIGELPADVQVKLLRVLQEHVIERLGDPRPIKVDVRIIAATNRNLERAVENNTFREDLYYRLNVFPIEVPPLRERLDDIPSLVWTFVDEFSKSFGKTINSIPKDTMRELQSHSWPGNIRELRNVVERAVIVAKGPRLTISLPRSAPARPYQEAQTLEELEVVHIRTVLEAAHWRVRGPGGAAERLGLKPTTLESRMTRFGIKRPA